MVSAPLLLAGVVLDQLLGEPRRWHPLVGFGRLAGWLERRLNQPALAQRASRWRGVCAWLLAVLPLTLATWALASLPWVGWLVCLLALYLALGLRSLNEHCRPIARALEAGELDLARERVGYIVSRDTRALDAEGIARATTESVLENGSDAVFAALFWFLLLGAPGVVLYRLANTLDAMWGYRTTRYRHFGWAAARLDDGLNYLPARLVALTYALCGHTCQALACWRTQAPQWDSPNAGPVMAAGAGALNLQLGGGGHYHGQWHIKPTLGAGPAAAPQDIGRALRLVRRGVVLWVGLALLLWLAGGYWHA
ncbi:adenosylcobinamide-phosphate synthase CbiB [Halopseudomonas salegens]|uniref:Cobalamin biosynthesis protein CobD n=1 Tax=Halopseudomonas salegens TaxID=1434072 RepID=A0A1H2HRS0_9GAMM|nr:adenosylcobinamide-phosphate synthase CbiB [Halopseudomonas salegens]SDU34208.1 adenosylcobinamide-phosphate synthase [Halopseudomonas salegens]